MQVSYLLCTAIRSQDLTGHPSRLHNYSRPDEGSDCGLGGQSQVWEATFEIGVSIPAMSPSLPLTHHRRWLIRSHHPQTRPRCVCPTRGSAESNPGRCCLRGEKRCRRGMVSSVRFAEFPSGSGVGTRTDRSGWRITSRRSWRQRRLRGRSSCTSIHRMGRTRRPYGLRTNLPHVGGVGFNHLARGSQRSSKSPCLFSGRHAVP
jgi:hypothetical protein